MRLVCVREINGADAGLTEIQEFEAVNRNIPSLREHGRNGIITSSLETRPLTVMMVQLDDVTSPLTTNTRQRLCACSLTGPMVMHRYGE